MKLNEDETLDIAFLPMLVEKSKGKYVTDEICRIYREAKFENYRLKQDISHIIEVMINKYFENPKEKDELLKMTIDEIRENAINELLKPEHQRIKELEEKTEKLEEKSKKIEEKSEKLEKTIQTLQKNGGLNSKGLEIINSIMLTK